MEVLQNVIDENIFLDKCAPWLWKKKGQFLERNFLEYTNFGN